MRVTTIAVVSALAVAVVGGSSAAHAAEPDTTTATTAASGTPTATGRSDQAGALAGWREGPYLDPGIAAAAAQLTIGIGRASSYYLVQVWDTVRQTTNWWIHYT
ncbi:hypothetical protein [Streptomyces lavendofoliae]|uniref:Uncharacterized protein n=1 Tax=Streptomyces lavendofoliae TaxID=67314 RepID=A0A918HZN3_9ACTN|nr:hypothetical protein [Streptomyces lavendofoliae]GGU49396.1 hypothetical protein GCM10010274_42460 [Streptomyces lavendofoliae]